jgi:hypothetical protein
MLWNESAMSALNPDRQQEGTLSMANEQPSFEHLTTAEVKRLYLQTREEALKQRSAETQNQARRDLGIAADYNYYIDDFGNAIPGSKPPAKHIQTYVDSSGYVQELHEGESAPVPQGRTLLEQVTKWVNENPDDHDIKGLLPEDLSVFEEQSADFPDYVLFGTLRGKKWYVSALNEKDDARAFKFVLSNDLDREGAISAAHSYLETRVGPKYRELSQKDLNLIQRTSVIDRNEAMLFYLRAKLPLPWADELESLIVQSDITGSVSRVLEYVSKPEINKVLEEAIFNVFFWNKPHIEPTEELKEFLQQRTANIVLTFPVLDTLLKQYQTSRAVSHLGAAEAAAAAPSQQDLDDLSDDQVADLFNRTRVEVARSRH